MTKVLPYTCAMCGKELQIPTTLDSLNWIKCKSLHRDFDFFAWESEWKLVCEDCASGVLNKIFNDKESDMDGS